MRGIQSDQKEQKIVAYCDKCGRQFISLLPTTTKDPYAPYGKYFKNAPTCGGNVVRIKEK